MTSPLALSNWCSSRTCTTTWILVTFSSSSTHVHTLKDYSQSNWSSAWRNGVSTWRSNFVELEMLIVTISLAIQNHKYPSLWEWTFHFRQFASIMILVPWYSDINPQLPNTSYQHSPQDKFKHQHRVVAITVVYDNQLRNIIHFTLGLFGIPLITAIEFVYLDMT